MEIIPIIKLKTVKKPALILTIIALTSSLLTSCDFFLEIFGTANPAVTYTVSYNANDATSGSVPTDSNSYENGASVTTKTNSGNLARSGYDFNDWNTAANGSGTARTAGSTFSMGSENVTLYAQWTAKSSFSVTYNANDATSGSVPTDSNSYEEGATVTAANNSGNLTRSGYSFNGWNTEANGSGSTYSSFATFTMGSADATLYAKWTTNSTYTVTYDTNNATTGSVPTDSTNYENGQTVIVASNSGNLARSGYNFNNWNTAANGSGTTRTAGSTFSMGTGNVTLYAQWTAKPTYSVTYNSNSATSGSVPTDSNSYEEGATVTAADNTGNLTRTGYSFNGWNTAANGSGTSRSTGSTFAMGSANLILYAEWESTYSQQIGTSAYDTGIGITLDSSQNVYIVGLTFGALEGSNAGNEDPFQRKSNSSGAQVWIDQFGTSSGDRAEGVAVDSSGNIYLAGWTGGAFSPRSNSGNNDPFLMKYNSTPSRVEVIMPGTAVNDDMKQVALDSSGNVYAVGNVSNAKLFKYNSALSTQAWTQTIAGGTATDLVIDSSNNAYVTGYTTADLDSNTHKGNGDYFLAKYDSNGTKQWGGVVQDGTNKKDYAYALSVDSSNNVYITMETEGSLHEGVSSGSADIAVVKYNSSGNRQWTRQLGTGAPGSNTNKQEKPYGIANDSSGNVYVTGGSNGNLDLDGYTNAGSYDVFLIKYNTSGTKQWTRLIGTSGYDRGIAIAVDSSGNSYITGVATGSLDGGTHHGDADIFLLKYDTNGNKK